MTLREDKGLDDGRIEENVRQLLGQAGQGKGVYVVASDGYIHLSGDVRYPEEKKRIGSWVEKMPGVRIVTNHLRVQSEGQTTQTAHF